jgi:hypothetical protein
MPWRRIRDENMYSPGMADTGWQGVEQLYELCTRWCTSRYLSLSLP